MLTRLMWSAFLLCVMSVSAAKAAEEPAPLEVRDGDQIVFFGDSITQSGAYVGTIEAWLLARYPDHRLTVTNRGISSETISGTSEPDHHPRRPWAHERFERDITPLKPQILFSCFGMNDGNYHPFGWERFEKYQAGIHRLIERADKEAGVRDVVLLTPPPFDPYRRKNSDEKAKEFGYKYPSIDYDETLGLYADWLVSLDGRDAHVVDLHGEMNTLLTVRRADEISFHLAPDAVHPNETGHWLMAVLAAEALGLPEPLEPRPLAHNDDRNKFSGRSEERVPFGVDPKVDEACLRLMVEAGRFQHWPVAFDADFEELDPETELELFVDGSDVGAFTVDELQSGIELGRHRDLPAVKRGGELLDAVRRRQQLQYGLWRRSIDPKSDKKEPTDEEQETLRTLGEQIEKLRQPLTVEWELRPVR